MKRLRQKLRARRGETLVETLVSILILALSSVALLTLISTATRITGTANDRIQDIYAQEVSAVEAGSGSRERVTATLTVHYAQPESFGMEVMIYGQQGALRAYFTQGG